MLLSSELVRDGLKSTYLRDRQPPPQGLDLLEERHAVDDEGAEVGEAVEGVVAHDGHAAHLSQVEELEGGAHAVQLRRRDVVQQVLGQPEGRLYLL